MSTINYNEYANTTARLAILKAKAAYACKIHPGILVLSGDSHAEKRAFMIAQNTLKYNDRVFLMDNLMLAMRKELEVAGVKCWQCALNSSI